MAFGAVCLAAKALAKEGWIGTKAARRDKLSVYTPTNLNRDMCVYAYMYLYKQICI